MSSDLSKQFSTAHTAIGGGVVLPLFLLSQCMVNGAMGGYVSDLISALQNLPSWLPDVKFKRNASKWDDETQDINRNTFGRVQDSVTSGISDV
ncbi:hypothetical protein M407DRAFT_18036 [Tulasnella calospora MUT 4182]|uniref:Uncharacterized protein n=1 Tax=Tulasnella calospora MUT 4182 TaxID=1051891 RepID=A0A0C3MHK8_9AGAM|nr:hypothetical protein M407DRAFT_18036 [Tulasnella calospora MUT 4182]